jgi:hypothetical protein
MIASGMRTYPCNYAEISTGVALVAADAKGNVIMARDACGLGNPGMDVSPARWSLSHGGEKPPRDVR